ncbi:MAG: TatD family hydrolase [Chloroflexi bacterium]|nr:TatD family hydrolase [Chloroflexota bacterium]
MDAFDQDCEDVISRAKAAGVERIVTVGIDLESSGAAIRLAEQYAGVSATVGFHPGEASRIKKADMVELEELAAHPRVVAIGETGLDFYRNYSPREAQVQVFKWQLELAAGLNLPVIIHCRDAENKMIDLLHKWAPGHARPEGQPYGVIHCFRGDFETAQQYLDMGFFLSLGAYIGYPSSRKDHDTIRGIPLDKVVVETDCPFLPPQTHRGKRNEPAYLPLTVRALADIREITPETVAKATTQNACRLFRLGKHG